jgi:magnesium transporter
MSQTGVPRVTEEAVWIDLLNPTQEEEGIIERGLKCDVPTREELQEIEASSRLYQEDGAFFMTATLVFKGGGSEAQVTPATFILVGNRLLTVRYAEPGAFALFLTRCSGQEMDLNKGCMVLIGLLEAVVDRLVGFIEHIQAQVEQLSHSVFKNTGTVAKRQRRYDVVLQNIGHEGEVVSKVRESCHSLGRLLTYLAYAVNERKEGKGVTSRVRAAVRDVNSLTDHATFLSGKIVFLLDATLGMIQIQQNDIIKIFSVAAVVFLPPTLIASIYGMNFQDMPELNWVLGYPVALGMMILFAILPYLYFKHKGWLERLGLHCGPVIATFWLERMLVVIITMKCSCAGSAHESRHPNPWIGGTMTRLIVSGILSAFCAAAVFAPASAGATPSGLTIPAAKDAIVHEAGWRRRSRTTVVDAPTTSVRTNDSTTDVQAPFTDVRTSRRGTWVRAPFVNLFVPK